MQAHGLRVASGQDQGCALALLRADCSEVVDRTRPLIVRGAGPGASSGPAARDLVLLAHARLVLPPQFYGGALREARPDRLQGGREVFFKSLQRLRVLSIVTRASREFAIAQAAQFP